MCRSNPVIHLVIYRCSQGKLSRGTVRDNTQSLYSHSCTSKTPLLPAWVSVPLEEPIWLGSALAVMTAFSIDGAVLWLRCQLAAIPFHETNGNLGCRVAQEIVLTRLLFLFVFPRPNEDQLFEQTSAGSGAGIAVTSAASVCSLGIFGL